MPSNIELKEELKMKIAELLKINPLDEIKLSLEDSFTGVIPGFKILTRVKDLDRALEKIDRKGYTNIKQFTDLTGIKIITRNVNDLYKVVEHINNNYNPHSADDYIKSPKTTGYKGYHANFMYNGINVEVQLQTQAMARASQITHDIFYKQVSENITANAVSAFKMALPSWITAPVINTIQKIIFGTVIPFDVIQKQGLNGLTQFMKDLKYFSKIEFAPKAIYINHTVVPFPELIENKPAAPTQEEQIRTSHNVREQYMNEFEGVKYISDETALAIDGINAQFGRKLSISELKDLRQRIGQDLYRDYSPASLELFKKLDGIHIDIKLAQNHDRNEQLQHQNIEKSFKKYSDLEQ